MDMTADPGWPGFLGTRASFMLDFVFVAMFAVVPLLGLSIYLVKYRRQYALHKAMQIALGVILAGAVTAFEVDMRLNGWRHLAEPSPYYRANWSEGLVNWSLWIHLCFAITTCVLWVYVIVQALRKFPRPIRPGMHSRAHIFWARLAALDMTLTAVTGWVFYGLAFVA